MHEARIWQTTRTVAGLGVLTARWLTGEIHSQSGYHGPVDVGSWPAGSCASGIAPYGVAGGEPAPQAPPPAEPQRLDVATVTG